mmetsp:Transcript_7220/g.18556  ORF Transcript_7220/g.18556 Transcript_7220/m.18556 type:complete len:238 (+) Transcript_7220:579-1292(+)
MNLYGYLPGSNSRSSTKQRRAASNSRSNISPQPTSSPDTWMRLVVPQRYTHSATGWRLPWNRRSHVASLMASSLGWHGRTSISIACASIRRSPRVQYMYARAVPGARPRPAVQWMYAGLPGPAAACAAASAATPSGRLRRRLNGSKSATGQRTCVTSPRSSQRALMSEMAKPKYSASLSSCRQKMTPTFSSSTSLSTSAADCGHDPTITSGNTYAQLIPSSCRYCKLPPIRFCIASL